MNFVFVLIFGYIIPLQSFEFDDSAPANVNITGALQEITINVQNQHKPYSQPEALKHGKYMTSVFFCILQISVLIQRHMKS